MFYRKRGVARRSLHVILFAVGASAFGSGAARGDEARPPNLVVIISDDQFAGDFGFMGHPWIETPHIDGLARQSARYPNGYVPASVCRPSLATLLTGLYPHQHGVHFNHPPPGFSRMRRLGESEYYAARSEADVLIRTLATLPGALAERGYRSLQTGKHWEGDFSLAGFTEGMTLGRPSEEPAYGNLTLADGSVVAHGNGDAGLNIGRTTMQPIREFLDRHVDEHPQQPFMIWYAPFLPHLPHDAPERFRKPYLENADVPRHMVDYSAACTWFDETVGELVDMIERWGQAGETLFVFVIDNGFVPDRRSEPGGPQLVDPRSKRAPFDAGLRTPILLRWDGRLRPAEHPQPVSSVDLVPTMLAAAGLDGAMGDLPGIDLLPSARGDQPLPERPVFGDVYPGDASAIGYPGRDVAYRWVREGRFKLVVPHLRDGRVWGDYVTQPALFDVQADPWEEHDLSGEPEHAETLQRLHRLLDRWWTPDENARLPRLAEAIP